MYKRHIGGFTFVIVLVKYPSMKNEIIGPLLLMLLLLLVTTSIRFWNRTAVVQQDVAVVLPEYRVPINSCSTGEMEVLPGIARKKAERISRFRRTMGTIKSWDELTAVDGIGKKTAEQISGKAVLE